MSEAVERLKEALAEHRRDAAQGLHAEVYLSPEDAGEVLDLLASLTGEGEPVEDHEPVGVGKIGNYYGGLSLKREGGVDFWSIENYDGDDWEAIPASLANELRALSASGGGE